MNLVEKHIISKSHPAYAECDHLCFLSKNMYNVGLYSVRQYFFNTEEYLNYNDNYHATKDTIDYKQLPTRVSKQTLKLVDKNFKSFFSLLKLKSKGKYDKPINIPKYLHKVNGRYIARYEKGALNKKHFNDGLIRLSATNIYINTQVKKWEDIVEVRIIPKNGYYVIEVVYKVEPKPLKNKGIIASIDLGLNNLATIVYSDGSTPHIVNGKPLKSINQYYNKIRSKIQSELEIYNKKKVSNRLTTLTNKRHYKIEDYLHNCSRMIVNHLVSKDVCTLVIGYNVGMKQDINIGKRNNQNFVMAPIGRFVDMLRYKCELEGIDVMLQEESYTSKSSFLSNDPIPTYKKGNNTKYKFSGYRRYRGLYRDTVLGKSINADVNGAYNILRKAVSNVLYNEIEGVAVHPLLLERV